MLSILQPKQLVYLCFHNKLFVVQLRVRKCHVVWLDRSQCTEQWDQVFQGSPAEVRVRWGVFEPSYRGPGGIWELLKDRMSAMVIIQLYKAEKQADPGENGFHHCISLHCILTSPCVDVTNRSQGQHIY